jgi:AcrR family transcriptional regulator
MAARNSRDKLIRTAIDLFYYKGYADTPIRVIGSKAGISNSLLYHYFKNKQDILFEIINTASQDLIETLLEIQSRVLDPLECLREMLIAHTVHFSIKRKKESKILVEELYWLRGKQKEIIKKAQREIYAMYMRKHKQLEKLGVLNEIDLTVLSFSIFGVINGFFRWYKEGGRMPKEAVAEEIVKFIFHGIVKPQL